MFLNDAGKMVENEWLKLPERFKNIELHEYIVMPNYFYAILEIVVGEPLVVAQNSIDTKNGKPQGIAPAGKTLGDIVGAFKSIVMVKYIYGVKNIGWQRFNGKLWQRNYYEHIIRNE